MTNKRPKPEEIVSKLRQVEVLMGQGPAIAGQCFIFLFGNTPQNKAVQKYW
ncbi:hypothetical protein ACMAY7_07645 [Rhodobacteraceae bacterium nBUS_24]